MHMGERVKDTKVQTLKMEFEGLRMKESELIGDFATQLTTIISKIRALGEKFEETYVLKKFLCTVPNKFPNCFNYRTILCPENHGGGRGYWTTKGT